MLDSKLFDFGQYPYWTKGNKIEKFYIEKENQLHCFVLKLKANGVEYALNYFENYEEAEDCLLHLCKFYKNSIIK